MSVAFKWKGLTPGAAVVLGLVVLAAGATGGTLFERGRRPVTGEPAGGSPAGSTAAPSSNPAGAPRSGSGDSDTPGDTALAGADPAVAETQAEAARLKERIAELEKLVPKKKTKEVRIAEAKEIVASLGKENENPETLRRLIQLVTDLDPAMAPYFLECFGAPNTDAQKRTMLCRLALGAGGPEAADWVLSTLTEVGKNPETRLLLLDSLSGMGHGGPEFSLNNLPVSGPLADLAFRYATGTSENTREDRLERLAGTRLLGGVSTVESRTILYQLATSNFDVDYRSQAIRALGTAGDRETLARLDIIQRAAAELGNWEKERIQSAIDDARKELKRKYP